MKSMAKQKHTCLLPHVQDLTGLKIKRLRVLQYSHTDGRNSYWFCRCDCGTTKVFPRRRLPYIHSCGCYKSDWAREQFQTHGKTKTKEHRAWCGMITRCYNTRNHKYPDYGGRGVIVCERWRHSFESFLADMGQAPSPAHSIDRIDNDGPYSPDNCRWATATEQARNQRKSHILTHNDRSLTTAEWAIEIGIPVTTLHNRLSSGWSVEKSLSTPLRHQKPRG
jgi:hypothetical protein